MKQRTRTNIRFPIYYMYIYNTYIPPIFPYIIIYTYYVSIVPYIKNSKGNKGFQKGTERGTGREHGYGLKKTIRAWRGFRVRAIGPVFHLLPLPSSRSLVSSFLFSFPFITFSSSLFLLYSAISLFLCFYFSPVLIYNRCLP